MGLEMLVVGILYAYWEGSVAMSGPWPQAVSPPRSYLKSPVEEPLRARIQVLGRQEPVRQPVLGGESVDVVVVDPPLAADEFGEARRRPGLTGFGVNPPAGRIVPGASVVDEGPGASGGGDQLAAVGGDPQGVHVPVGDRRGGRAAGVQIRRRDPVRETA